MIRSPATALRSGLHLLLAACLMLQATVALALGTSMAVTGRSTAPLQADAAMADEAAPPPCHATAATAVAGEALHVDASCCDDGGLCEWVCASAPPLAGARIPLAAVAPTPTPFPSIAAAQPRWLAGTPLRPPIA